MRRIAVLGSLIVLAVAATAFLRAQEEQQAAQQRIRAAAQDEIAGRSGLSRVVTPEGSPEATRHSSYRTLLKKISVPGDQETYGDFYDYGYWPGGEYAGNKDIPPGYWVYLAPDWYIFKDSGGQTPGSGKRPWGPEQATGAPDTWPNAGDLNTAWASKTPDGQREWLELTYDQPIRPIAIMIFETFNPGAVDRVTAIEPDGKETQLWSGTDPTPTDKDKGVSVIGVSPNSDISKIRIYLDSQRVPGWNEIDAVGLLDAKGVTHWATGATASSTYADVTGSAEPAILDLRDHLQVYEDSSPAAQPKSPEISN